MCLSNSLYGLLKVYTNAAIIYLSTYKMSHECKKTVLYRRSAKIIED